MPSKLTWPHLLFVGNGDTVYGFVRAEICPRVFRQGHFPPYGCGLRSRLPHQKGLSPCKGGVNSALKECPSHLWTSSLQTCTQEKQRSAKPRSALSCFAEEGRQSFWIHRRREPAAVCKITMWWATSMRAFQPCNTFAKPSCNIFMMVL